MRRAPSRQISSSARLISALASSSVTTLNIGVPSSPAITRRSFVLGQRGRYAAPPIRWPIHNFRSYLQEVQGEHGDLLVFPVGAGEFAFLAVEQDGVGRVPVLDDLEAFVDFAAQGGVGEVVADEGGPHRPAEFLQGSVGGVLGTAPGEAAQYLFGFGGPQTQRGGVLDELVVLAGDELPVDRPGEHPSQAGPGGVVGPGTVETGRADVLQPGQELETEQVGEGEADDR